MILDAGFEMTELIMSSDDFTIQLIRIDHSFLIGDRNFHEIPNWLTMEFWWHKIFELFLFLN